MPFVLRHLAAGWQTEIDNEDSPPYLRNPSGQRYILMRDDEDQLILHSSTSKIDFDILLELYRDYMAWESGKPGIALPEGWTWHIVPDSEPNVIWGARYSVDHFCYIDGLNQLVAEGIPVEVVRAVLRAKRGPRVVSNRFSDQPPEIPTRFDAIREGTL